MAVITFTGDILPSERMNRVSGGDYRACFAQAPGLSDCDYLVGNLETPVAGEEMLYTHERYCFNTPEGILDALHGAGFNLLTLANNHCMDRGEEGIRKTLEHCRKYGFDTVGLYDSQAARDEIFVREIDGIRVAFLNYTYGTNAFAHGRFLAHPYMVNLLQPEETRPGSIHLLNDYRRIAADVRRIYGGMNDEYAAAEPYLLQLRADIRSAREQADYVIAVIHNGGQYIEAVDPYSAFIAEKIRAFGADLIVGHHQHLIQPCSTEDGFLKIFCLGNFLYDNRIEYGDLYFDKPTYSAVFRLSLTRDEGGSICAKKQFAVYTTMTDSRGLPVVMDSAEVFRIKNETHLRSDILRYANLFAAAERYAEVQPLYDLD